MMLLQILQEIASTSSGVDSQLSNRILTTAAYEQGSMIGALLDSQLIEEDPFLKQLSAIPLNSLAGTALVLICQCCTTEP